MQASDLANLLTGFAGDLRLVINDLAVTSIETATGRIRRDIMTTSFLEMPDKPRDTVLVPCSSIGPAMTVREAVALLSLPGHADLPIFIHGEAVHGVEMVQRRLDAQTGRYPHARRSRKTDDMVTFVHWTELSDGHQALSQIWTKQT